MAVGIRTGVSPAFWMNDTRALVTAIEILDEMDRKRK